jgi:putative NADPH-quinone reductase
MRALVVYCHPREGSFTAAVRDTVLERLEAAGAEVRLTDLYARGFSPALTAEEHAGYEDEATNQAPVQRDCDDLMWCDTLIFVYPTWWYGQPAVLKGWIDRVFVPGVAFRMPTAQVREIRPGLTHITRLGCFTTCGASWWLTRMIGAPGRRTILRGVRLICAPRCKTAFAAHYRMDSSTPASRAAHLARVSRKLDRFLGGPAPARREAAA